MRRGNLSLHAPLSEAAGDEHALAFAQTLPRLVEQDRVLLLRALLEVGGGDVDELKSMVDGQRGVVEGLDHRGVRVLQLGVFTDQCNVNILERY